MDLPYERVNESPTFNCTGSPWSIFYNLQKSTQVSNEQNFYLSFHTSCDLNHSSLASFGFNCNSLTIYGSMWKIDSDNAKNSKLNVLYKMVNFADETLAKLFVSENINYTFIPPRIPHFGGLWEVGVKSVKQHFKWAMGDLAFNYEEFGQLVVEVESILNLPPYRMILSHCLAGIFQILRPLNLSTFNR